MGWEEASLVDSEERRWIQIQEGESASILVTSWRVQSC